MIRYIEAPGALVFSRPALFLAGGITNCPDWQRIAVDSLSRAPALEDGNFTILNPRRSVFDVTNQNAAREQITWEWKALRLATVRMFWFPPCLAHETVQPIALFELGRWSALPGGLVVGADPDYPRALDVHLQMELERPGLEVHTSLASVLLSTVDALVAWHALTDAKGADYA